jgi:hypothetical protein
MSWIVWWFKVIWYPLTYKTNETHENYNKNQRSTVEYGRNRILKKQLDQ